MRLNKFLAGAGVAARRKCDELIRLGRVSVNGKTVTEPWLDVHPGRDTVVVEGKPIEHPAGHSYLLLHKPPGVITTVEDTHGRKTVIDLLGSAAAGRRLFPVGRLDADTTGALLLTDDGELAFRLTHPRYVCSKEYVVRLAREIGDAGVRALARGIELEDGMVKPDRVRRLGPDALELVLHEGRKRVVRRMVETVGHSVTRLHRRRFAGLSADDLPQGSWRELTLEETNRLRTLVGLEQIPGKEATCEH